MLGIRSLFVAHWVNNAFAGAKVESGDIGTFIATFNATHTGRPFETVRIDRAPDDWLRCAVEADVFKGHGGPGNLHEILDAFARWADIEPRRARASRAKVPAAG